MVFRSSGLFQRPVNHSYPLFVALLTFLPILIQGSESRQWLAALPISVALVAMHQRSLRILLLLLFWSLILCVPVFFLTESILTALNNGSQGLDSEGWQVYFGRQGPWMSQRTYVIGLVAMLLFSISYLHVLWQDHSA